MPRCRAYLCPSFGVALERRCQAVGDALLHGKGVQQNVPEALKWLHTAADRVPLLAAVSTTSAHVRACVRACTFWPSR